MGMFDSIICKVPLPLKNAAQKDLFSNIKWDEQDFQTKDLDNLLNHYTIRKNGDLVAEVIKTKLVRVMSEAEEKKSRNSGKFTWPYKNEIISRRFKKIKHTGVVEFYTHLDDTSGNEWWIEFVATFVDGKLKGKIKQKNVEFFRSAEEIKKSDESLRKMMDDHERNPWNKAKRFLNKITFNRWRMFWRFVETIMNFVINTLTNLKWWIVRNMW